MLSVDKSNFYSFYDILFKKEKCVSYFELINIKQKNSQLPVNLQKSYLQKKALIILLKHMSLGSFVLFCHHYFSLYFVDGVIQGKIYQREMTLL